METSCSHQDRLRVEDTTDTKSLSLSSRRASVSPRRQSVQFEGKEFFWVCFVGMNIVITRRHVESSLDRLNVATFLSGGIIAFAWLQIETSCVNILPLCCVCMCHTTL